MNAPMSLDLATELQPKSPPLIQKILVVLAMITLMGGSLTGVMTYFNLGYSPLFFKQWLTAFLLAAITVMPMGFVLMAAISKAAEKLLPNLPSNKRDIGVGVLMALIMESGMAFSTSVNNVGLSDGNAFFSAWLHSLIAALPVAIVLMTMVSLTVKPKIERFLKS